MNNIFNLITNVHAVQDVLFPTRVNSILSKAGVASEDTDDALKAVNSGLAEMRSVFYAKTTPLTIREEMVELAAQLRESEDKIRAMLNDLQEAYGSFEAGKGTVEQLAKIGVLYGVVAGWLENNGGLPEADQSYLDEQFKHHHEVLEQVIMSMLHDVMLDIDDDDDDPIEAFINSLV